MRDVIRIIHYYVDTARNIINTRDYPFLFVTYWHVNIRSQSNKLHKTSRGHYARHC